MNIYSDKIELKLSRLKRKIEETERNVFHYTFSRNPTVLYQELNNHKSTLDDLKRKRVLNAEQYALLLPTDQKTFSENFDTTLLHVLLRSLCGLNRTGLNWNNDPPETDQSIAANLIRLKIGRNKISHLGIAATNNTFYRRIYRYLKQPLLKLGCTSSEFDALIPKPIRFKVAPSIEKFANRDTEIQSLHDAVMSVQASDNTLAVCLSGLSGIGKTQLAKRYCELFAGVFGYNVVWLDATNLAESYKELAQFIHITITDKPISVVVNDVNDYFAEESIIFVFDNYVVDNQISLNDCEIFNFLPNHHGATSLITSQRELPYSCQVINIRLKSLTELSAINHVNLMLQHEVADQESDITAVLEKLGYHPLAVQQFITFLQETHLPVNHYLKMLQEEPNFLLKDNTNSVAKYLKITINNLQTLDSDLPLKLLRIGCFLNGKEIHRGFFLNLLNDFDKGEDFEMTRNVSEALSTLERYSLIQLSHRDLTDYRNDIFTIHALVQQTMKCILQEENNDLEIFRDLLLSIFCNNDKCKNDITFIDCRGYKYFFTQLLYFSEIRDKSISTVFLEISMEKIASVFNVLFNQDRLDIAAFIFTKIETLMNDMIEQDSRRCLCRSYKQNKQLLLRIQFYIGQTYYRRRKFGGASLIFDDVRKKQKRLLGNRHKDYLASSLGYVSCFSFLHKYEEGMELSKDLHAIHVKLFGENHPHSLILKRVLLINRSFLENHSPAVVKEFEELLRAQTKVHGATHLQVFTTRHEIARRSTTSYDRMESLLDLLSDMTKHCQNPDMNEHVLRTKYNIGRKHLSRGNYKEALEIFNEVHYKWLLKYGDGHEDVKEVGSFIKYLKKY